MKKALKRSISVILAVAIIVGSAYAGLGELDFNSLFAIEAKAADESVLTFTLNDDGVSYSVTNCSYWAEGEIIIPAEYEGLPVTEISSICFQNKTNITGVTISENITTIGEGAFNRCTSLVAINVNENNTAYSSIDGILFSKDKATLLKYPMAKEGVSYTIPEGVTSIGKYAFSDCANLQSIEFSNTVTDIGNYAFQNCVNIETTTNLDSITNIGNYAFQNCTSLETVTIPSGVTNIGSAVFDGCTNLKSINVDENNTVYASDDGVLFDKDKINLIKYPIGKELASYAIPEGVTSIDNYAFEDCTNVETITIPEGVTSIGARAFGGCVNLQSIAIPDTVTNIGNYAFEDCVNIKSFTIPYSVTSIGDNIVEGCTSLEAINVDENNTIYSSVDGVLFNEAKTTLVRYPLNKSGNEYTIPDTVKTLSSHAFDGSINLTSVEISYNVSNISDYAFYGCTGLTCIEIPWYAQHIGWYAFYGCTNLKTVVSYGSTSSVGSGAFWGCSSLESVTFYEGASSIGSNAFYGCSGLKYIFYGLSEEHWATVTIDSGNTPLNNAVVHYNSTDHTFSTEWTVDVEPTCTEEGSKSYHCTQCDEKSDVTAIDALGHDLDEGTQTKAPACAEQGVLTKTCQRDNCTYTEDSAIDALGHDFSSEWTIDIEPTCEEEGSKSYHCSRCDEKSDVTAIDALGHDLDEGIQTMAPTCDDEGVLTKTCQRDNCTYTEDSVIDALGHNYSTEWTVDVEPTCYSEGSKSRHCSDCEATCDVISIAMVDHTLDEGTVTLQPTCIEEGILTKACTAEGCTYTEDSVIDALGHEYSTEWTVDIEPTCTEEGSKSRHCTACGDKTDITAIECIPHDYSTEWTIDKEASCSEEGSKSHHCTACGDKADITAIEKLPHTPSQNLVHAPGFNCESGETNYMHRLCTVCKAVLEVFEVEPGHSYVDGVCEKCGLCNFGYTVSNGKVTITGYTGPIGQVAIPTTIGGYPVEKVGANAFSGNSRITDVIIPDGMIIGDGAFDSAPNLKTVTIGNNVTLGTDVFVDSTLEKVIFTDDVVDVQENCFNGNTSIKEVVFGNNVKTVGASAFNGCTALESIYIPESVDTIGASAFCGCTALEEAVIDGATTINAEAFKKCGNLYTVEIGDKTEVVCTEAFAECGSLTDLLLGNCLKTIEEGAFSATNNLQAVRLPEGLQTIGENAFLFSGIQTVIIPDSVESIGDMAFATLNLKYVQLGKGVKSVGAQAFYGFYSPVFVIPKEVSGLSEASFILSGNTTVYYDGTEEQLEQLKTSGVFREETDIVGLNEVNYINELPVSCGYVDDYFYYEYPAGEIQLADYLGFESSVTIPSSINDKPVTDVNSAFFPVISVQMLLSADSEASQKNLALLFSPAEITIPESVTFIDDFAFVYCMQTQTINLPEILISIGMGAFYYCLRLTNINLPHSLKRIGFDAFVDTPIADAQENWENNVLYVDDCLIDVSSNFTGDLVVKDGTRLIADGVATGNTQIQNLYLPESLEIIGESAFSGIFYVEANIEGEETVVSDPTQYIFYKGTQEQWNAITIHNDNDIFTMYPIHFEATDHVIASEWETDVTPGCTHSGIQVKKCLYCTYKITEEIPATGHTLDENGVCKYCTSEVAESAHYFEESIDETVTLQKETAGSVTLTFSDDTYAGYIYIYDANDTLIGEYAGSALAGETIIIQGNTVKIRMVSGGNMNEYGYYADVLWACAHTPAELVNVKEATCEQDGYTGDVYCKNCPYVYSMGETVSATGHNMENNVCLNCGECEFDYEIADGQVTITGYQSFDDVVGAVQIPSTIGGYPVVAIDGAFEDCDNVTQISIPSSVTSISDGSFLGAWYLTDITVSEESEYFTSVDGVLFNKDKTKLICYPTNKAGESYEIPEGVEEVGAYSFSYAGNLREVDFPSSVTTIDAGAFLVSFIESVVLPDSVKTISESAFESTTNLKYVEIGSGVESVGTHAFLGYFSTIVLPSSLTNLTKESICAYGDLTVYFDGTQEQMTQLIADKVICYGGELTVIYGKPVAKGEYEDFRYIETPSGEIHIYNYVGNAEEVTVPSYINEKPVTCIGSTFMNYVIDFNTGDPVQNGIKKITIPDTVKQINYLAFFGNTNLITVELPDTLTKIGGYVFEETLFYMSAVNWYDGGLYAGNYLVGSSSNITEIEVKEGTTLIADYALGSGLQEILIPTSLEYIGANNFGSSAKLTAIFYPGTQEQWSQISIAENNEGIDNAYIHYNSTGHTEGEWIIDTLPTYTAKGSRHKECSVCELTTQTQALPVLTGFGYSSADSTTCTLDSFYDTQADVVIPEEYNGKAVTAIGSGCFKDDMFVESIVIPETVTEIGSLAFMNCEKLESVRIPESVTSIGTRAFYGFNGTIICYYGSYAHDYAVANNIDCTAITVEAKDSNTVVDYDNKLIFTTLEEAQQLAVLIKTASALSSHTTVEVNFLGTGNVIQLAEDGNVIEEYTLIVDGDLNGDSVCDALDAAIAANAVNGHKTVDIEQVYAANGEIADEIDAIDYQRLVNKAVA